jgi:hypothetical protein
VRKEVVMVTELLQERTSLLQMTVELPNPVRIEEKPIELLVHLLAEREAVWDGNVVEALDGEPTWEDAAWQ